MSTAILDTKEWGNNLGVRLSTAVVRKANLHLDQRVQVTVENTQVVITPVGTGRWCAESFFKFAVHAFRSCSRLYLSSPIQNETLYVADKLSTLGYISPVKFEGMQLASGGVHVTGSSPGRNGEAPGESTGNHRINRRRRRGHAHAHAHAQEQRSRHQFREEVYRQNNLIAEH